MPELRNLPLAGLRLRKGPVKMREKELKVLVTFPAATAAMAMEAAARRQNIPGRLVPVPGIISAGCGMAWMSSAGQEHTLEIFLKENSLSFEKIYQMYL